MAEMGWTGTAIPESVRRRRLRLPRALRDRRGARALRRADAVLVDDLPRGRGAAAGRVSEAQKRRWLPRIAGGEAIGCLALAEGPQRADAGRTVTTRARRPRRSPARRRPSPTVTWRTSRSSPPGARRRGRSVAVPGRPRRGRASARTTLPDRGSHALARADHLRRRAGRAARRGRRRRRARWSSVLDRAAVLVAFEQVGGAQAALDMAREYAWALRVRPARSPRSRRSSTSSPTCTWRRAGALQRVLRARGRSRPTRPSCRWPRPPRG